MISLFSPFVPPDATTAIDTVLKSGWLGQGERVEEFEKKLSFLGQNILTVNSGTSALELAYHLLGLKPGDEVISPVFTAVATNLPLVRRGVKIVFADVRDDLLMDFDDVQRKITPRTKAVINAHLFGLYNEAPRLPERLAIIGDACQYLDRTDGEVFTAYSFQATKIITTVDGGALACQLFNDYQRAKLLRWYGIDRESGGNVVDVDIQEAGYKYHMNDVTASFGILALGYLAQLKAYRLKLQEAYTSLLGVSGGSPFSILVKDRDRIRAKLFTAGIETGLVHRRNDYYSVFGGRQELPMMDKLENHYLFLPCHNNMTIEDVIRICSLIRKSDLYETT